MCPTERTIPTLFCDYHITSIKAVRALVTKLNGFVMHKGISMGMCGVEVRR